MIERKTKEEIRQLAIDEDKLIRDVRREEMTRIEEAARTDKDFEEVVKDWDKLDTNRRRRERLREINLGGLFEEVVQIGDSGTVVPQPLDHKWWRQMMQGEFLDVIFDCPHDIHEMTSSRNVSELIDALRDNQKEVLFFRAVWQWSPQKIAAMRGQTDRNIRKVYDTLINGIRKKLYERLLPRYIAGQPLTLTQREFVKHYREAMSEKK